MSSSAMIFIPPYLWTTKVYQLAEILKHDSALIVSTHSRSTYHHQKRIISNNEYQNRIARIIGSSNTYLNCHTRPDLLILWPNYGIRAKFLPRKPMQISTFQGIFKWTPFHSTLNQCTIAEYPKTDPRWPFRPLRIHSLTDFRAARKRAKSARFRCSLV